MLSVTGGIVMVLGMIAIMGQPVIGFVLVGIGYWIFNSASPRQRSDAAGVFFGLSLVCMAFLGLAALI